MKKIFKKYPVLIIAIALAIGVLVGYWFFSAPSHSAEDHQGNISLEEFTGEWTCSMHPQIRQNEPGNCPICGMELIPVGSESEDEGIDPKAVRMSATALKLADVQTITVNAGTPVKEIRLIGKVAADERRKYTQSAHIPGRVERLNVTFTGEYIRKGQVLGYVYSPELVSAQEELFEAAKIMESQPAMLHAAKEKLKNWKLSEEQIDNILSREIPMEEFPILANYTGYVTETFVNSGDYLKAGQEIFEIADLSKVWILFDIYESEMRWIQKGDEIEYSVKALTGEDFTGRITFIDPVINPATRTAKARIETSNTAQKLKPDMFVRGRVQAKIKGDESIIVPASAVMWTGKRSVVYVKTETENGIYFRMREVMLGAYLGDSYVIESGLEVGEEVAVNGTFSIDAAAQLENKPSMMNREIGRSKENDLMNHH